MCVKASLDSQIMITSSAPTSPRVSLGTEIVDYRLIPGQQSTAVEDSGDHSLWDQKENNNGKFQPLLNSMTITGIVIQRQML